MNLTLPRPRSWPLPLLIVGLVWPTLVHGQQSRPRGGWRLDAARTDSMSSRSPRPVGSEGPWIGESPTGGAPGVQPRPGSYGGGPRSRSLDDKTLAATHQAMELVRHAPTLVNINPDDSTFTVTDGYGGETTLRIDGKKQKQPLEDGGSMETSVKWKADALVVERKVNGRARVTETYLLGLGGNRLMVFVTLDGPILPLDFTRQYQPADSLRVVSDSQ
jgi:hypothetical protein